MELWVQESQVEEYSKWWEGLYILPPEVTSLGKTREYLVRKYWGEKIVLMDDDLTFYWRRDPSDWHLTCPPPEALVQMFGEVEDALESYAHVGLSGREGQNRESGYSVVCTRYMRLLAYNTALWPSSGIRCDRLNGLSDFDTNLQLLRAGLPNLVYYRWAQGQRSTASPGGMSGQRSHATHTAEVLALCELHPGLVVPYQKRNRSGGAFGTRDEVMVSWKQALGWDARAEQIVTPFARVCRELDEARDLADRLQVELTRAERLLERWGLQGPLRPESLPPSL